MPANEWRHLPTSQAAEGTLHISLEHDRAQVVEKLWEAHAALEDVASLFAQIEIERTDGARRSLPKGPLVEAAAYIVAIATVLVAAEPAD